MSDAGAARALVAEVRGVSVRFGATLAVEGVDLAIRRGELVSLIGPNGSGKTTLVKALLGLVPLAAGRVTLAPGARVGYVPQRMAIDRTMPLTARRFLALAGRFPAAAIAAALDETGIGYAAARPVQALSGGEIQRLLVARALLRQPDLLVLDEPVQGVDVAGQAEMYRWIGAMRDRRGCAVLMISHDLHLVMAATDTVVCLNRHVCCSGRPEAISRHPAYLDMFGFTAAEALAVYTHRHDHVHDTAGHVHGSGGGPGHGHAHGHAHAPAPPHRPGHA